MKRLLIIDANSIIHRAYHALPPLSGPGGRSLNAVYGFCSIFLSIIKKIKPDYVVAAFDLPTPTFRHKIFDKYKAQRPKTASQLIDQIPLIKEVLSAFNIPMFSQPGFEADDIIGTIAYKIQKSPSLNNDKIQIIILTGDLDALQLVNKNTVVCAPQKGLKQPKIYNIKEVEKRYDLKPKQLIDYKGLKGDSSDNIPGVPGIGKKTAVDLLQKHNNLENIYQNLGYIKESTRRKLEEHEKKAWLSRKLGRIRKDTPVDFQLDKCHLFKYHNNKVVQLFEKLNFNSLIKRLNKMKKGGALPKPQVEAASPPFGRSKKGGD